MGTRNQEADHGRALIRWRDLRRGSLPGLAWLHHVPNGVRLNARRAAIAKAEGLTRGVPDYNLPWRVKLTSPFYATKVYTGLAFELKKPGGYPTPDQRLWLNHYHAQGWLTFVAWHWLAARYVIELYLDPDLRDQLALLDTSPGAWLTPERAGRGARVYPLIREEVSK